VEAVYRVVAYDGRQQRKPNFKTAVEDVKALATVVATGAESVFGRRAARFLGMLVLFAVVVGALLVLLDCYIAPRGAEQKQALVVTLAQILGGAALLSGLYFTWRTLQVNREGQITERFTRAIDQLGKVDDNGKKQFEIRIGGIYALERLARESEEDHWPIMEVLTAYVRQNAPRKSDQASRAPDPDIQAIMTVLRRRTRSFRNGEPEPLVLNGTSLRGVQLWRANLSAARISDANLSGASFWEANLSATLFSGADLSGAIFSGANLSGADLRAADLRESDITQEQLEKTYGKANTQLPPHLNRPTHWGRG
jgi:Pentapeptide repeats (8 copies)